MARITLTKLVNVFPQGSVVFQISRKADYAIRVLLALGRQADGMWTTADDIGRRMNVPLPFLHKLTADLVQAGLVRTRAGPKGGLVLGDQASTITVRRIIEAVEGPIALNMCLIRPQECPRAETCPAHSALAGVQRILMEALEEITLAALVAEGERLSREPGLVRAAREPIAG